MSSILAFYAVNFNPPQNNKLRERLNSERDDTFLCMCGQQEVLVLGCSEELTKELENMETYYVQPTVKEVQAYLKSKNILFESYYRGENKKYYSSYTKEITDKKVPYPKELDPPNVYDPEEERLEMEKLKRMLNSVAFNGDTNARVYGSTNYYASLKEEELMKLFDKALDSKDQTLIKLVGDELAKRG